MEVIITAVGPDHVGLADPIIHHVTGLGANISEIQMFDRDEAAVFAMLLRIQLAGADLPTLKNNLTQIGDLKGLSVRVWSSEARRVPRLAICTTLRNETPLAVLRAIRDGQIPAEAAVMVGNRPACRGLAEQFHVPWENIGDEKGNPDDELMVDIFDRYDVDYVVLARYMRVLPPSTCWKYAGGRIINLHHGLLPGFPGIRPYHDAYAVRMLVFGATCHFIVPELDAGNQTIHQSAYSVKPGTSLEEVIRLGQEDNEPRCLLEGVRRVVQREVKLHFHRVIPGIGAS
ncbi:MAG: formyltetrahydrofolate deformylase [Planctomycetales bacterium]|nr:formyltetrahydrofolate deformylase [Planctomycetales bacterium]